MSFGNSVVPLEETIGHSREVSFGAGLRLKRGRFGLEAQHHRVTAGVFTPAALVRDTGFGRTGDLAIHDSSTDLVSAMVLMDSPVRHERSRFFVGLGAGYALMDGGSDRLLRPGGLPPGVLAGRTFAALPGASVSIASGDYRADRGATVLGGSAGIEFRAGRLVLRPRLDGFLGRRRAVEESWEVRVESVGTQGVPLYHLAVLTVETNVRPRLLLLSVDVGWSSRP